MALIIWRTMTTEFFVNTKVTRSSHLGTVCYCIIQIQRFVSSFDCLVLSWSVQCSRCLWISCLVMYLFCACIVVLFVRQIYNQETSTIIANLKIISRSTTRNPAEIQKSFRPVFSIWDSGPIRFKKRLARAENKAFSADDAAKEIADLKVKLEEAETELNCANCQIFIVTKELSKFRQKCINLIFKRLDVLSIVFS